LKRGWKFRRGEGQEKFLLRLRKFVPIMFSMLNATASLTDRFAWLFDGLCKAIGVDAHRRGMEAALAWAIWNRVRVLGERFIALATRVRSGRLPAPRAARREVHPPPRPSPSRGEREGPVRTG
jgi:hypothetical protein